MKHSKNLRKHRRTYISLLHNVPNGAYCRHTGQASIATAQGRRHVDSSGEDEGKFFIKTCDAFQTLACSKGEVIFGRFDLVEVFK